LAPLIFRNALPQKELPGVLLEPIEQPADVTLSKPRLTIVVCVLPVESLASIVLMICFMLM
jgi:hypothetical protein